MSLEVKYVDVPLGAQEAARATTTTYQPFGWEGNLIEGKQDFPWATLESDSWSLDGTREILSDTPYVGWWSMQRSGADGRFAEAPVIQIDFPQRYTATGITFDFWPSLNHWCSEISAAWYRGGVLLQEVTAFPDAAHWVLERVNAEFDRIEIRLLATNIPGHFAKIRKITIGQIAIFGEDELVQVRLLQEADPSGCELSVDTLSVTVRDRKNRKLFPQKNQSLQLYRDDELLASHYISDFSRQGQFDYSFRGKSSVGRLEDMYLGGIVHTTAGNLLANLLADLPYAVDAVLEQEELSGYLPVCTRREALQQIALAIGAVVTTQADGRICLENPSADLGGAFADDCVFMGARVTQKARIARVQLMAHSYTPGDRRQTLLNGEYVSGADVLYMFSSPHYGYEITGGVLTGQGDNWVTITADGAVTLTALNYIHTTVSYTRTDPEATPEEWGNVLTVKNATLVNPWNAPAVLLRLYVCCTLRDTLQQQVVVSGQKVGQLVYSVNPWNAATEGYLVRMESDFTGAGHTADITILGKEVPRM